MLDSRTSTEFCTQDRASTCTNIDWRMNDEAGKQFIGKKLEEPWLPSLKNKRLTTLKGNSTVDFKVHKVQTNSLKL